MENYRGSSSGHGEQAEQVRIEISDEVLDIPEGVLDMLKLLDAARISDEPDKQQPTRPRTQEVPSVLRDKEMLKRYYEPMVVAIGPIHSKLPYGEEVKLKLAGQFIQENGIPRDAAFMKILGELQALKDCYQEKALRLFNESDLAFMFLVDGCALLHFMASIAGRNKDLLLHHVNYDFISFAERDIFLLENQLPYRLLQLLISFIPKENTGLFNLVRGSEDEEFVIRVFILMKTPVLGRLQNKPQPQPQPQHQPLHLLDLLHRNLTFVPRSQMDLTGYWGRSFMTCNYILNRLSTFHNRLKHYTYYVDYATFRSAKELKSVGIGFNQSPTSSVRDVTFQQKILRGTLSLPSIIVNDSSISIFLNLVAYERCPDFKNNLEVTSYIRFLDALIGHSEDVRELRHARILRNGLGSDKCVAKLFNQMAIDLKSNPEIYLRILSKMHMHHQNTVTISTWLAEMEKYFSNPLTFLAVCGAVFGLVLGFIQTWFALKSYYHPRKA